MNPQIVLIPLAIGVGIAALTAWINITIKFANNAEDAKRDIKRIFYLIVSFLSQCIVAYFLFKNLISDKPLDRVSVFAIIVSTISIVGSIFSYLLFKILVLIEKSRKEYLGFIKILPCIKEGLKNAGKEID
jgi:hypothetical protein